MLDKFHSLLKSSYFHSALYKDSSWDSLIINRRKPTTYRIFQQFGPLRVCLHCFHPCDTDEAFKHPHPWPGAFHVLKGGYDMDLYLSKDREDIEPIKITSMYLTGGSEYEITNPLLWHSVAPATMTYTIMVNDKPWEPCFQHVNVRTTAGKDLKAISPNQLTIYLKRFRKLISASGLLY